MFQVPEHLGRPMSAWSELKLRILVGFKAHLEDQFNALCKTEDVHVVAFSAASSTGAGGYMMMTVLVQERLPESALNR